jgi:hypothetical protein
VIRLAGTRNCFTPDFCLVTGEKKHPDQRETGTALSSSFADHTTRHCAQLASRSGCMLQRTCIRLDSHPGRRPAAASDSAAARARHRTGGPGRRGDSTSAATDWPANCRGCRTAYARLAGWRPRRLASGSRGRSRFIRGSETDVTSQQVESNLPKAPGPVDLISLSCPSYATLFQGTFPGLLPFFRP